MERIVRNRLFWIWILAGILLPLVLGAGSWLAYSAGFGFLSEGLAGPFFFSAPLAPFAVAVFFGRAGQSLVGPVSMMFVGNGLLYAGFGYLAARWQTLPRIDRWLRLVPIVGATQLIVLAASSVLAFTR